MASGSRIGWALATAVGISAGLAGYVLHAALTKRHPQIVEVRRWTNMGSAQSPAISPDGKTLAFVAPVNGRSQIWVADKAITQDDEDHFGPRWSADSASLIFFASNAVWEIPDQGGAAQPLAESIAPGDLSHTGKHLAYARSEALLADEQIIAKLPAGRYSNLRWSPDDKKIAYLKDSADIWVASTSGGDPKVAFHSVVPLDGFAWLPDGSGLIVSSSMNSVETQRSNYNLWVVPRDNSALKQLTFGELSYESPDTSAAGDVFVRRVAMPPDGHSDIIELSGMKFR